LKLCRLVKKLPAFAPIYRRGTLLQSNCHSRSSPGASLPHQNPLSMPGWVCPRAEAGRPALADVRSGDGRCIFIFIIKTSGRGCKRRCMVIVSGPELACSNFVRSRCCGGTVAHKRLSVRIPQLWNTRSGYLDNRARYQEGKGARHYRSLQGRWSLKLAQLCKNTQPPCSDRCHSFLKR
jgi:hypothetical protein